MLNGYRFSYPVEVRFSDLDGLAHVNNAVYLTYMESARLAWWAQVTGRGGIEGLDMILARTEVDYRAPASYGDELVVGVRCASVGRTSFVLQFAIEDARNGRLYAEARKVLVRYDYVAGRAKPIDAELRERILAQDPDVEIRPPG